MFVLPLLNIRQSELVLRSDNVFLLGQCGVSPELLLFRDQLDLRALHKAGRLRLTLVDHNVLPRLATLYSACAYTHTHTSDDRRTLAVSQIASYRLYSAPGMELFCSGVEFLSCTSVYN